jgi:hypothetical protein
LHIECLVWPLIVVQHDDGTPTGSRSTSFFIRGILGPDAWSIFMRWLRRLAERFSVAASLVGHPGDGCISKKAGSSSVRRKPQKHPQRATDRAADRKAALAFEKEQKRRKRERAMEEAAQRKERERRQKAIDKAQSALDAARREHEKNASDIQAQLEALEERSQTEETRWEKEKARLEAALRGARGYG